MSTEFLTATKQDIKEILDVYAPYILNTVITFETEVPSLDSFTKRIDDILSKYPFFVCKHNGKVVGYSYASKFKERAAYNSSVETTVYISPDFHKKGVGTTLYTMLLESIKEHNYYMAYACISLPNEKSIALHNKLGFTLAGTLHNAGYKFGKYIDIVFYEKKLQP